MYRAGSQNLASRNSPADPPDPPDPAKVAYGPQLVTPLPRAGGMDEVSSKETPSNKQIHLRFLTKIIGNIFILAIGKFLYMNWHGYKQTSLILMIQIDPARP